MKRSWFFAFLVFGMSLSGNSFAGQYKVFLPIITNPWIPDCVISGPIVEVGDYGLTGSFKIPLEWSSWMYQPETADRFALGQSVPNGAWKEYPIQSDGSLIVDWPQGEYFEFSYGFKWYYYNILNKTFRDPACSRFSYPPDAPVGEQRLRVRLGTKRFCKKNIDDKLVVGVEVIQPGKYKIFLNFLDLPITNYQKIFVKGQGSPDSAWIEYSVLDGFPCFSFILEWPQNGGSFHFSFGVIRSDGGEQWVDPTQSKYICGDQLCLDPENY